MASPGKRQPPAPAAASAKTPPRPARRASPPSLRFQCGGELHRKTCAVLDRVEGAKDPAAQAEALAEVVVALTGAGLDAYFMEPLKQAKAGFVTQQSAALGLAGARNVLGSVLRTVIGRMDGPQLRSVCGSIRTFMD